MVSVVVSEKMSGIYNELITIGIAKSLEEVDTLMSKGWSGLTGNRSVAIPVWICLEKFKANVRRNCQVRDRCFLAR